MESNKLIIRKELFIKETKGDITEFYQVLKKIGEGGFSKVYIVKEKETGEIRAMKQVDKSKIIDIKNFKTEIKILAMLDHPNILRLFDVIEDSKNFYLIMELCTGGELLSRMSNNRYKEKGAAKLMEQIVSAVAYCHEKGICHRDLKPQNILFYNEEENSPIKIVDFGISKIYNPSLSSLKEEYGDKGSKKMTTRVGTMLFLSPEVLKGNYTEKCDVWSLGVILYILLCGYPPFNGSSEKEILQNISSVKFSFPQAEWKNISESAKDLISSMLCPEKKRISSKDILKSKWFKSKLKNKNPITFDYKKLDEFRHFNKFKQAVLVVIASRLKTEEFNEIADVFKKINECKTGMISFEDFKKFLINNQEENIFQGEKDEEIRKQFLGIDIDYNNKIDFTEFLAANLDKSLYLDKIKLKNAFDIFDSDKNGIITKENIIEVLKIEKLYDNNKLAMNLIEQNDINKDGKIDFDEFYKLMNK